MNRFNFIFLECEMHSLLTLSIIPNEATVISTSLKNLWAADSLSNSLFGSTYAIQFDTEIQHGYAEDDLLC